MRRTMFLLGILALIGVFALFTGCGVNQPADDEAVVEFAISSDLASGKTIQPGSDLVIKEYQIQYRVYKASGTPNPWLPDPPKTITSVQSDGSAQVYLLLKPGYYDFKVDGFSAIGDPSVSVLVLSGKTPNTLIKPKVITPVGVTVTPIEGVDGTVNITVDWSAAMAGWPLDASFYVTVFDLNNVQVGQPFVANPAAYVVPGDPNSGLITSASITGTLPTGYYKCTIQLRDDDQNTAIWSTVEALRVLPYEESTAVFALDRQLEGIGLLTITKNMVKPLLINYLWFGKAGLTVYDDGPNPVNPLPPYISVADESTTVVIEAWPQNGGNFVDKIEWFFDGVGPIKTDSNVAGSRFAGSYSIGSHTISVLVTETDPQGNLTLSSRALQIVVESK